MTLMTEEWVRLWYQCLTQNSDYGEYCSAKERGDSSICRKLEKRFDRIAEIYSDFGGVGNMPDDGLTSQQWRDWFGPRQHLFLSGPNEVLSPQSYSPNPSRLLLSIPLSSDPSITSKAVHDFLITHYSTHEVVTSPPPKYQLHALNGRVAHGIQKVRQACRTTYQSYLFDEDLEYRTIHATILEFLKQEIDKLGWKIEPVVRRELMDEGTMNPDSLESYRVMLNKARRDLKAFSKNTVRGRFPDDTAFESDVIDHFWGE